MYERSSVVEHVLHTDGVVGSIPIVRTIFISLLDSPTYLQISYQALARVLQN